MASDHQGGIYARRLMTVRTATNTQCGQHGGFQAMPCESRRCCDAFAARFVWFAYSDS
jgi:hypothetical protein